MSAVAFAHGRDSSWPTWKETPDPFGSPDVMACETKGTVPWPETFTRSGFIKTTPRIRHVLAVATEIGVRTFNTDWNYVAGYSTQSAKAMILGMFIAALVAQSRIETEAHTIPQTVLGALLGFLLTTAVFQVFWR